MAVILVIEDDLSVSDQIEKAINTINRDIRILKTSEGKKAFKIASTIDVDVFIIDVGLPDCNGIDLAKDIRKVYAYQPIIIESSECDPAFQIAVHDQIENLAFLSKPYPNDRLVTKVNHALDIASNLGDNKIKIVQNGFLRLISIDDILYIEKVKGKKRIEMVLYNQDSKRLAREEFAGVTLNSLLDNLNDKKDLFRCHKGFIVNPKRIRKLNYADNTISLKYTDDVIPVGKTYKNMIDLLL